MVRGLGWGLRVWALVQVAAAALWVLGPYGASVYHGQLPDVVYQLVGTTLLEGLFVGPIIAAGLTDPGAVEKLSHVTADLAGPQPMTSAGAYGDILPGWSVQFATMTGGQNWSWVALHVLPLLVMAALWWYLARMVAQSASASVFTVSNARRLTMAGSVVLLGAPVVSLLTWAFHNWVADSSQIASRIEVPTFGLADMPWTAMAAGFALLMLGQVWRRGVAMANDLGGLV